jgi:DNA-binding transcriptional regulator YhcF (GntR family)
MNWAWELRLSPGPKLIMMALADAADDDGVCWPSVARLASKCCVSTRTVRRVIQEFTVNGLLMVTSRFSATGRQKSNGYRLQLSNKRYHDKLSPSLSIAKTEDDNLSRTRMTSAVRDGDDNVMSPQEPPYESLEQPPHETPEEATRALHFPAALLPDEHAAVTSIICEIENVAAQALLDELSAAMENRAIRTSPVQWLRSVARRYKGGQFEPSAGVAVAARRKRAEGAEAHQRRSSDPAPSSKAVARAAIAAVKAVLAETNEKA